MDFAGSGSPSHLQALRAGALALGSPTPAPRILLLTSGLGLGHVRAAQAIEQALAEHGAQVRTVDLWSLMNPGVAGVAHQTYLRLVQDYPQLWERLYHLDEQTWRQILQSENGPPRAVLEVLELISGIASQAAVTAPRGGGYVSDRMLLALLCAALPYDADSLAGNGPRARLALMKWAWIRLIRRLEPTLHEFDPQVVISTQMVPAAMASALKVKGRIDMPLVGVMTDFGVHDFWKQPSVDGYCVAHASVAGHLDIDNARVIATGVPLMPGFAFPVSQAEARRQLQLEAVGPVVLVLGGGLGLSVEQAVAQLLQRPGDVQLLVLPGKNTAAYATLASLSAQHPRRVQVREWTDRMDLFIRAADLIVGKPGGITVAESLACGRPLLATRSLGGQEGFNVRFLERHGVGGLVADGELLDRVEALLHDRQALLQMQRRAWLLGARDGAARVAELCMELAVNRQSQLIAGEY